MKPLTFTGMLPSTPDLGPVSFCCNGSITGGRHWFCRGADGTFLSAICFSEAAIFAALETNIPCLCCAGLWCRTVRVSTTSSKQTLREGGKVPQNVYLEASKRLHVGKLGEEGRVSILLVRDALDTARTWMHHSFEDSSYYGPSPDANSMRECGAAQHP